MRWAGSKPCYIRLETILWSCGGYHSRRQGLFEICANTESQNTTAGQNSIDEAVLALLYLGIHERHRTIAGARTWKSFDWDAMNRLHHKGLISDPATKAKSVRLTETGLSEAEAAFRRLFVSDD